MIRLESLSKGFGSGHLFSNLSLTIGKGEKCALIGRNGSGKTTLLRMISGEETSDGGKIHIPKNYRIGILTQHAKWTKTTPLEEAQAGIDGTEIEEWKASKMLFNLGFDDQLLHAPIASLSGGYCLRLQLAKLLLSEPDLLLLDEPTNYLDIKTVTWLAQFLKKWPTELIAISHDREFLDTISTHTMGLHRKELIRLPGKTGDYFSHVLLQEELHQKKVEKSDKQKAHLQQFVDRFGAKASKAGQAQSKQKMIDRMPQLEALADIYALSFAFRAAPFEAQVLMTLDSVGFAYPNHPSLFENLSCNLTPQSRICIAGKNGRGKSTLLKLIRGDLSPCSGIVKAHPNAKIGYFGQTNIDRLDPAKTIEEEIASTAPELTFEQVKSIAGVMMFTQDDTKKRIGVLSGGEKSRVLLGKILATPVNILLLDEPTNHLDIESIEALSRAIESFKGAVCLVTHSELLLSRLSNSLVIFEDEEAFFFPDTYSVFCETKGWKESVSKKPEKKQVSPAQTTQERTKALAPVKKEIDRLEKKIDHLERQKNEADEKLAQAAQAGNRLEIENWGKISQESALAIESHFILLEQTYTKKNDLEASFG